MNKKFKYKKSLLAAILSATLLAGCDGGGSGSSSDTPPVDSGTGSLPEVKPDPTPNPEPTPEPTPDPEPTPEPTPDPEPTPEPEPEPVPTKTGYLTLGGSQRITGATCNGESSDGFTFTPGDKVTCVAGNNTTIATFDTQSEAARSLRAVEKVSFSLEDAQELAASDNKKSNAVSLVTSMNSCPADTEQVCLEFSSVIESKRFDSLYKQIDLAPEEFKKLVNEEVENNAATDKAPSTHTSPVVPATTPGTKPDLNASFVSANAEQFYQYQPTEIILSEGRLVDSQGDGVVGVNYYTNSGRGVTGENGEFSFSWGETISFGIDTFELGSVRGNKSTIALTELGDEVRGANIDQLIHRYSKAGQNHTRVVPDEVRKVFAEYPNVINEIINLSLSNGATLGEGEQVVNLPNEFIEQFKTGQAKEIDTAICAKTDGCNEARWFSLTTRNVNDGQIQGVINKLWGVDTNYKSVSKFHVFHDSTNFYGSTGNARGQAVVNISNAAFPILMARNDKNYWLAFGEKRAWDKNELAYITEAPSLVEPENVTRDTATFNLPFISLGQVGDGKLMVIGKAGMMNPSYPLNYMEKPLTRLMLGRSWWDLNIKVDVEKYPGVVNTNGETVTQNINLYSAPTKWFAGNMQSTGLWAPAQQEVSIESKATVPVTVTVALADDLTGREKHEVSLNRPPRVTKTYDLKANDKVTFKVPYGGLIYIKGDSKEVQSADFTFTGVVKAPFYKDGKWQHDLNSPAPLGELESASFVYTTPKKNLNASNYTGGLEQFANDLDTFASSMNDFYGRDSEDGKHRMFTYKNLPGHKHRFANDVQISIGDAHSGYLRRHAKCDS